MIGAAVVGLVLGGGLTLVAAGLWPAPPSLARVLADLHRDAPSPSADPETGRRFTRVVGEPLAATEWGRRLADRFAADLAVTRTPLSRHMGHRAALAGLGLGWAPAVSALMWAGGVRVDVAFPLWVSAVFSPLGFLAPSLLLRREAAECRRAFRHALSTFLDVVALSLAAGCGVDTALNDAARAGRGWAFEMFEGALTTARLQGHTPWAGLDRLGTKLAIPELRELAASAGLAGAEGARVRLSVGAKARALRQRLLAEIESAAHSATERMSLPIVLLLVGFLVFLGYPAVERVLTGL